ARVSASPLPGLTPRRRESHDPRKRRVGRPPVPDATCPEPDPPATRRPPPKRRQARLERCPESLPPRSNGFSGGRARLGGTGPTRPGGCPTGAKSGRHRPRRGPPGPLDPPPSVRLQSAVTAPSGARPALRCVVAAPALRRRVVQTIG